MVRPDQRRGHGVQTVDLQAHVGTRRGPRAGLVTLARGRRHHRPLHVQLGLLLATVCAALGVGLLVGTPTASAHALLVRSDPSSGATVASSPKTVKMWFNEEITPDQSSARIVDSDGAVVTGTRPVSSGDPRLLQLALPPLPTDSYGVLWTVTAEDDGHTTTGTVVFGVGVSVAAPAASDATPSTSPGDVVRHWLRIGALAGMVGATGILLIFLWIGADPKVEITVTAVERRMLLLAAWSAVVGLGVAAVEAQRHLAAHQRSVGLLRDRLEAGILAGVSGTVVNGDPIRRVHNTTNISFERVEAESLLIALDLEGIAVSTGSACSSGTLEPSHVLKAMGLAAHRTQNSLRFSLGMFSTEEEVDRVVDVLPRLVDKLRGLTRKAG